MSTYLRGSSAPQASRTLTGVGLRLAQDLGAHRKKMYDPKPNEEQELMKRAFWFVYASHHVTPLLTRIYDCRSLMWLDWTISPALGRPCGIQYEE